MNFLKKIGVEKKELEFLSDLGFQKHSCGFGCCPNKSYVFQCSSGDDDYFNTLVVYEGNDGFYVINHQESITFGGGFSETRCHIKKDLFSEESLLDLINEILPDDLD